MRQRKSCFFSSSVGALNEVMLHALRVHRPHDVPHDPALAGRVHALHDEQHPAASPPFEAANSRSCRSESRVAPAASAAAPSCLDPLKPGVDAGSTSAGR